MSATPCGQAGDLKEMPAAKSAGKTKPTCQRCSNSSGGLEKTKANEV